MGELTWRVGFITAAKTLAAGDTFTLMELGKPPVVDGPRMVRVNHESA